MKTEHDVCEQCRRKRLVFSGSSWWGSTDGRARFVGVVGGKGYRGSGMGTDQGRMIPGRWVGPAVTNCFFCATAGRALLVRMAERRARENRRGKGAAWSAERTDSCLCAGSVGRRLTHLGRYLARGGARGKPSERCSRDGRLGDGLL